jgi:hypothetical protein
MRSILAMVGLLLVTSTCAFQGPRTIYRALEPSRISSSDWKITYTAQKHSYRQTQDGGKSSRPYQSTRLNAASPEASSFLLCEAVNAATLSVSGLVQNSDVWVFVAGVIPFAWATVEFWRRIAVGESFGTGSDSVVIIGEDNAPEDSRGRRVLGRDSLIVAYVLFTIAFATLGIVLYSVISSTPPPASFS